MNITSRTYHAFSVVGFKQILATLDSNTGSPVSDSTIQNTIQSLNATQPHSQDKKTRQERKRVEESLFQKLIANQQHQQLLLIARARLNTIESPKSLNLLEEYFLKETTTVKNTYELVMIAFWMLNHGRPSIYDRFKESQWLEDLIREIKVQEIRKEALLMYAYSTLIAAKDPLEYLNKILKVQTDWDCRVSWLSYQWRELQVFLDNKDWKSQTLECFPKKHSMLELQLQCTLKTLKPNLELKRQVSLFNRLYQVDFLVEDKLVLQIHGHLHYSCEGLLKGTDAVREKVIRSKGYEYRSISHKEWSAAGGIRKQMGLVGFILEKYSIK